MHIFFGWSYDFILFYFLIVSITSDLKYNLRPFGNLSVLIHMPFHPFAGPFPQENFSQFLECAVLVLSVGI